MKKLLCLLGLAALCACGGNNAPEPEPVNLKNGKVVVVFEDCLSQTGTGKFGGSLSQVYRSTISYIDADGDLVRYEPRQVGRDTIEIPTFEGYAELMHMYQVIEYDCYLLQEGDTVLVNYDARMRPTLTSRVYEGNTALYNLPYTLPDAIQDRDYAIEAVLNDSHYKLAYSYFHDKARRAQFPTLKETYRERYVDLDSLNTVYNRYQATLRSAMDSLLREERMDPVYYRYMAHRFFPAERPTPADAVRSDSLLHYVSNYFIAQDYCKPVKLIEAFNWMAKDTVATPLARKGILRRILTHILDDEGGWHHYSKDVKKLYSQKYIDITGDSTLSQTVLAKAIEVSALGYTLPLGTQDGQIAPLESVLEKYRGKVVYVDLWASWCAPCIGQFPAARELHKRMAGEDVEFLFFSTDSSDSPWLKAVRQHADLLNGSYRIMDLDAVFLKEIQLTTIPRFLIYDRNGKLVDPDAPRPSDPAVDAALKRWL